MFEQHSGKSSIGQLEETHLFSDIWTNKRPATDSTKMTTENVLGAGSRKSSDNPMAINIEASAAKIADQLNLGRSDKAVFLLSSDLKKLEGQSYNQLLLEVAKREETETEGDDRGHLLLSDWNNATGTWDSVFISERDQLYRIVQPGNTLFGIAKERLGIDDKDAIQRYVSNIAETNSLPAPELIVKGQALRLPYPY